MQFSVFSAIICYWGIQWNVLMRTTQGFWSTATFLASPWELEWSSLKKHLQRFHESNLFVYKCVLLNCMVAQQHLNTTVFWCQCLHLLTITVGFQCVVITTHWKPTVMLLLLVVVAQKMVSQHKGRKDTSTISNALCIILQCGYWSVSLTITHACM